MHIALSVFLTAGRILLAVLAVLLFLLLLILLCPFFYRADIAFDTALSGKPKANAVLCWLGRIVQAEFRTEDDRTDIKLKVLGFRILRPGSRRNRQQGKKQRSEKKSRTSPAPDEKSGSEKNSQAAVHGSAAQKKTEQRPQRTGAAEKSRADRKKTARRAQKRKTAVDLPAFLFRPETREALAVIRKKVFFLVHSIFPRKITGVLEGGFEDPSLTGELLALWSVLLPLHKGGVEIEPDFNADSGYGRGQLSLSGRILLWSVVISVLGIVLDRNVRKAWKEYKKGDRFCLRQ